MRKDRGRERSNEGARRLHDGLAPPRSALSRRHFLRSTAMGAAGLAVGPQLLRPAVARAGTISRVVRTFDENATTGWDTVNQGPVDEMVHFAIRNLTGIPDTAEAWKSFFPGIDATKKITIKINLACGDVPTHPEVVNAIIDGLLMMDLDGQQLPEENIIVWDADNPFFCAQTGYTPNWGGSGVQYVGTNHYALGYDMVQAYPIVHSNGTTYHHPSKIITQHCDYMINAGVMKDHDEWAGITLCMKNHYGSFDGIYDTLTHYGGYDTGIPGVNCLLRDELGDKQVLFLIDGTFCLCDGGPGYTPPYHTPPNWIYNSLLVSRDPVALDQIGLGKINEERIARGMSVITASHIGSAATDPHNLGTDNLDLIDLREFNLTDAQEVPDVDRGPQGLTLLSPYPNPSAGPCTLRFHCQSEAEAELVITDVTGSLIRRIAQGRFTAGMHRAAWDGKDERGRRMASGTYFCRLSTTKHRLQQRLVLLY